MAAVLLMIDGLVIGTLDSPVATSIVVAHQPVLVPRVSVEHGGDVFEIVAPPAFLVQDVGDTRRISSQRRRTATDDRLAAGLVLFLDRQHAELRRPHVLQDLIGQTERSLAELLFAGDLEHQIEGQCAVPVGGLALQRDHRTVIAEQLVQVPVQYRLEFRFERRQRAGRRRRREQQGGDEEIEHVLYTPEGGLRGRRRPRACPTLRAPHSAAASPHKATLTSV